MMVRMQISLSEEEHRRVKARALERGVSVAEYVRGLVGGDLGEPRETRGIEAIFNLGHGGETDIAKDKDAMIGEAFAWEHERSLRRD